MALTIQELLASDTISQAADKINFNFDQLLLNGGGPSGPAGPQGPPGPIGGRGVRGSQWFEDTTPQPGAGPNTFIVSPDLEPNDSYLQANGNVWEYIDAITGWVNTGIDLTGPQGQAGATFWNITGDPIVGGDEVLYPEVYTDQLNAGNIRSILLGGVPSNVSTFDNNYVIDNSIVQGTDIGNTILGLHTPGPGVAQIRFFGTKETNTYTNDVSQAQAIYLLDGDLLRFHDVKIPLLPTEALGYSWQSDNKSGNMEFGRGFQLTTGTATQTSPPTPLTSPSTITLLVANEPIGNATPGKIVLQSNTTNNAALLTIGDDQTSVSQPYGGNILGGASQILLSASNKILLQNTGANGIDIIDDGASGVNITAKLGNVDISTSKVGSQTTIESPYDTLYVSSTATVTTLTADNDTNYISKFESTGYWESETLISSNGNVSVRNKSTTFADGEIGFETREKTLQTGSLNWNGIQMKSMLGAKGVISYNKIFSYAEIPNASLRIHSDNGASYGGIQLSTADAGPTSRSGYNFMVDQEGGISIQTPDRDGDVTDNVNSDGTSNYPIWIGKYDDRGTSPRFQRYGLGINPTASNSYYVNPNYSIGTNSIALIGRPGIDGDSSTNPLGPYYKYLRDNEDSDTWYTHQEITEGAVVLANAETGGGVALVPGREGVISSPSNTGLRLGMTGLPSSNNLPYAFMGNGKGAIIANNQSSGGMLFSSNTSSTTGLTSGAPGEMSEAYGDLNFCFMPQNNYSNHAFGIGGVPYAGNVVGSYWICGNSTNTANTSISLISAVNNTRDVNGSITYWGSAVQKAGDEDAQTNGFLGIKGRQIVINTTGDKDATDADTRSIRIGGGWQSHIRTQYNYDVWNPEPGIPENPSYFGGSVILGDGFMEPGIGQSFLYMKWQRMKVDVDPGADYLVITTGTGNGAGAVTRRSTPSDIRLKNNIKPVQSSILDKLNKLSIITFNWKVESRNNQIGWDGSGKTLGFKAQELIEIFPDTVGFSTFNADECEALNMTYSDTLDEDGNTIGENHPDRDTKLITRPEQMIPILTRGIQELSDENKELKKRLKLIEEKLGL